jgi:hypothetical protein
MDESDTLEAGHTGNHRFLPQAEHLQSHHSSRRTSLWRAAILALTPIIVALAGCSDGGGITEPDPPRSAVLQLNANVNAAVAGTLVIEVTALDIATPLVFNFPLLNGTVTGTITIPAGSDRTITLRVYDTNGIETHRETVTVTLREGTNPAISITLLPLTGDQPIDVTLGTITISVSPALDTIPEGDTVRLTATVTDAMGDTVDVTVLWATLNPAVATVDSDALVTGEGKGSAQIVATYGGVGGAATIVVIPPPLTWTLVTGLPGENLGAVWGSAPDDIYNAGGFRSFNHYDGTAWMAVGYNGGSNRYSVFGLSATQVYSAGQLTQGTGHVIAFDGTSWQEVTTAGVELIDIWGSGPNDLYAVGDGTVLHWDGTSWTSLPTGLSTAYNVDRLACVWGTASNNVYTSGRAGLLLHWDGSAFTSITTGTTMALSAIHGSAADDVWVVGAAGVIVHYDGSTWQTVPSGTNASLRGVYAIAPDDVWIAGTGGLLLHWDGTALDPVPSGTTVDLGRVWAASPDQIYVGTFGPGAVLVGKR